jgi:lipopolysaccharide transport system permease protein
LITTTAMSTDIDLPDTLGVAPQSAQPREAEAPVETLTVIEADRGWQPINVRELWAFRELIYFLIWRDVKVRYKQTLLGAAWAILQPAMLMIVFTIFLGKLAKVPAGELPYPLFVYLGVLPWTFFATAITSAGNSVIGSERLVTKVFFPRLAIPIASVGAAVVDLAIAFGLLVAMMAWYGVMPGVSVVLLPFIVILIMLTALGIGTALAALNVLYRDFRYVIPFMVQVWMFATPTIYMKPGGAGMDGAGLKALLWLNPMTGLIGTFRSACLGEPIALRTIALPAVFALALAVGGCYYFRRLERRFADII